MFGSKLIWFSFIVFFSTMVRAQPPVHESLSGRPLSEKSYRWEVYLDNSHLYINETFGVILLIPKAFSIREEFDYRTEWGIRCLTTDRDLQFELTFLKGTKLAEDYQYYLDWSTSYKPAALQQLTSTHYYLSGCRYLRPSSWQDAGAVIIFYRKGVVLAQDVIATVEISCSPEDSRTKYKTLINEVINNSIKKFPNNPKIRLE